MFEYQADALPFPRGFSAGIYYTQPTTQYVSTRASCFTPCYFRYFPKYNLSSPQPSSFASLQSWTRSNLDRYKYRFDIYIYVYSFCTQFLFFLLSTESNEPNYRNICHYSRFISFEYLSLVLSSTNNRKFSLKFFIKNWGEKFVKVRWRFWLRKRIWKCHLKLFWRQHQRWSGERGKFTSRCLVFVQLNALWKINIRSFK